MNNETIIEYIKALKIIQPGSGFSRNSKALIVSSPQDRPFFSGAFVPILGGVLSFSFIMVLGIYLAGSLGENSAPSYTSLDSGNIREEFDTLRMSITLKEITYSRAANNAVASALYEISTNNAPHLNQNILEAESGSFDIDARSNIHIDALLNTVMF